MTAVTVTIDMTVTFDTTMMVTFDMTVTMNAEMTVTMNAEMTVTVTFYMIGMMMTFDMTVSATFVAVTVTFVPVAVKARAEFEGTGGRLKLYCSVHGFGPMRPTIKYQWTFNGEDVLRDNASRQFITLEDRMQLLISNPSE